MRGGGDLGQYWYLEGKMLNKNNTFADLIAAAELLIAVRTPLSMQHTKTPNPVSGHIFNWCACKRKSMCMEVLMRPWSSAKSQSHKLMMQGWVGRDSEGSAKVLVPRDMAQG